MLFSMMPPYLWSIQDFTLTGIIFVEKGKLLGIL